jgi:hypothetical protein
MKKFQNWVALCVIGYCGVAASPGWAQAKLEALWLAEGLKVPESVLVYREGRNNFLLVSQIDGDPSNVDGQGGIARVSLSGEVEEPDWVTGLNAPKGMAAQGGKLYVADINEIVIINIKKAEIEKKIPVPGAVFLNDVTIDNAGVVYVSDTRTNKVHRLKNGIVDDYLTSVESANGLKAIGRTLIVGAGTHLYLYDDKKNRLEIASGFAQAIDGVEGVSRGDFLVSCWPGLLYYVHTDGKVELLQDSQAAKINTADIGYDSATNSVYVPNFARNTVTAYSFIAK